MRKFWLMAVSPLLIGFFLSCASPPPAIPWDSANVNPNPNESVLIIRRTSLDRIATRAPIRVTIHGQTRILHSDSEEGRLIIPNGTHLIVAQPPNDAPHWRRELSINANSEQIVVHAEFGNRSFSIGLSNRENLNGVTADATGIAGALGRAAEDVARNFTAQARIAIVYVSTEDRATTEFITGELEHILWRRGFVIVDRSELDRIRTEQQLGMFGEVDDSTAARIGHFAGASVVITGGVDGAGDLRRLRLRALDTATAQVVGTASERI